MCVLSLWTMVAAGWQPGQLAEGWDFVPGERLLLYDDFTDMPKGGSTPHWKVRGASVKLGADGRLNLSEETELTPNVASWPANFTIEQEYMVRKSENSSVSWVFSNGEDEAQWSVALRFFADGLCDANLQGADEALGAANCKYVDGQVIRAGVWMQDGRIRLYLDGERLVDVNQVQSQRLARATLLVSPGDGAVIQLISTRIAESAPDVSKAKDSGRASR
jgi:hypothetical protein